MINPGIDMLVIYVNFLGEKFSAVIVEVVEDSKVNLKVVEKEGYAINCSFYKEKPENLITNESHYCYPQTLAGFPIFFTDKLPNLGLGQVS